MPETPSIVPSLATVLNAGGAPVGFGVLVEDNLVVTCAHVVAAALTGDPTSGVLPLDRFDGGRVRLQFTTEDALVELDASPHEAGWRPMAEQLPPAPDRRVSDLALLTLTRALPPGIVPYDWRQESNATGQDVEVHGYVDDRPVATFCKTSNPLHGTAWLQVSIRHDAPHVIDRGYSGSPLVRDGDGVVLGLLQSKDDTGRMSAGYMIRWREVHALLSGVGALAPELAPAVSHPTARAAADPDYPGLSQFYVERPELYARLRAQLLSTDAGFAISGGSLGLRGMGGVGKTVLAARAVSDPELTRRFPDGVFWTPLGADVDAVAAQTSLLRKMGAAGDPPTSVAEGRLLIAQAFADKTALVVLDDVWTEELVEAFPVAPMSRLLVTTRFAGIAQKAGETFDIELPSLDEAREILSRHADAAVTAPEATEELIGSLVERAGRLPLALSIIGAMARTAGGQWRALRRHLDEDHLLELKGRLPDYTAYETIYQSIGASVERLPDEHKTTFLALAVLPEDVGASLDLLGLVWSDLAPDKIAALDLANTLVDANLAGWSLNDELILHDLQLAYVRSAAGTDLPARHALLADAYRAATGGVWDVHPAAPYMLEHLPAHLRAAGRDDELAALLLDYAWLRAHVRMSETTFGTEVQLERYGTDEAHRLLAAILRQMRHLVRRYPDQLAAQLIGRVLPQNPAPLLELAAAARGDVGAHALVPLRASMRKRATALSLVGHDGWVNAVAVTPDGRRAVSGSVDDSLRVWDLATGESLAVLAGHEGWVRSVAVTPDGRRAVSGSDDNTLRVWDLATGCCVQQVFVNTWVLSVATNDTIIVAGDAVGRFHVFRLPD